MVFLLILFFKYIVFTLFKTMDLDYQKWIAGTTTFEQRFHQHPTQKNNSH